MAKKSPIKRRPKKATKPVKKGRNPARKSAARASGRAAKPIRKAAVRPAPKTAGMPRPGQQAPDFTLEDMHGHPVTLSKLRGTQAVVYFYPKDDTAGCTIEAKEFTKEYNRFLERGVIVLGISKDSKESHCTFSEKYGLEVPLLSDPGAAVIKRYGCWVEKNMYGKKVMGTRRATFIIDKEGRVQHVFPDVTPEGHAKEVLRRL